MRKHRHRKNVAIFTTLRKEIWPALWWAYKAKVCNLLLLFHINVKNRKYEIEVKYTYIFPSFWKHKEVLRTSCLDRCLKEWIMAFYNLCMSCVGELHPHSYSRQYNGLIWWLHVICSWIPSTQLFQIEQLKAFYLIMSPLTDCYYLINSATVLLPFPSSTSNVMLTALFSLLTLCLRFWYDAAAFTTLLKLTTTLSKPLQKS